MLFVVLLLVGAGRCVTEQDHAVAAVVGALRGPINPGQGAQLEWADLREVE